MTDLLARAWRWLPVAEAAVPLAAVSHGPAALRLLARLRTLPASRRAQLAATAAADWLVVLGPADDLPWAEGVRYAAPCPAAPSLWLPTHCRPDLPPDLLARALARRHGRSPLLLWPDPAVALPLDRQLPAHDALLATLARHLRATEGQA